MWDSWGPRDSGPSGHGSPLSEAWVSLAPGETCFRSWLLLSTIQGKETPEGGQGLTVRALDSEASGDEPERGLPSPNSDWTPVLCPLPRTGPTHPGVQEELLEQEDREKVQVPG